MTTFVRAIAVVALTLAPLGASAETTVPAEGTQAPPFTLNSQENKPVSLKDFHGKWVVLYFYPKDFTTGATLEAQNFQKDLPQYDKRNAVIVGVSVQSPDSHRDFSTKESLTFKLLSDVGASVSTAYGSTIDYKGSIVSAHNTFLIDPNGIIRKDFLKVQPLRHSKQVLAALTDLEKSSKN